MARAQAGIDDTPHGAPPMKILTVPLLVQAILLNMCEIKPAPKPPTTTEIFNLRTKCAELSQNLLKGLYIAPPLEGTQNSHYDPSTNRCYAEIDTQTGDLKAPEKEKEFSRYLYDGQTGHMLAGARTSHGDTTGGIFDGQHSDAGYFEAKAYIDEKMADDRMQ